VVLKFKSDKIKVRLKEIMEEIREAARTGNPEKVLALQKKDQALKAALRMISEKLGNRIVL